MLTVRGNSIHFRHTNGCSCEGVKVSETENVSTWEGLEPPTFGLMLNALTIWAIVAGHLLPHVCNHWLWRYRYFFSKVNWARATAFIFDIRCSCESVKVFETENVSPWEGLEPLDLRTHVECSNHWNCPITYHSQTSTVQPLKFGNG